MSAQFHPIDQSRIVVAIPTLNEGRTIETIVRKLASEAKYLPNLNIVVVDGGSSDSTKSIVNALAREITCLHFLENSGKIQSKGVNLVARTWRDDAEILIRCDAHAIYPDFFIGKLLKSLRVSGADSVVIPMDSVGGSIVQKAIAWTSDSSIGSGGAAHRGGRKSGFVDHGHHAAFILETFLRLNGYDETFSQNEDAEYDCRLRAIGGKIYLDANIRIKYLPRSSFLTLWYQYFGYGMGRSRTVLKHPRSLRARQLAVPLHILAIAVSILLFSLFHVAFFLGWPIFYILLLCLISVRAMSKHRSSVGLLTGVAAFIMHTSWGLGFLTGLAVNLRTASLQQLAAEANA